mgnify:CR=1 FL=1
MITFDEEYARLYATDCFMLLKAMDHPLYTKDLAATYKITTREAQYKTHKLEALGWLERIGQPRCPYQWYRVHPHDRAALATYLNYALNYFQQHPERSYLPLPPAMQPDGIRRQAARPGAQLGTTKSSSIRQRWQQGPRVLGRSIPYGFTRYLRAFYDGDLEDLATTPLDQWWDDFWDWLPDHRNS